MRDRSTLRVQIPAPQSGCTNLLGEAEPNRILLFKKKKEIDGQRYAVEISRNARKVFILATLKDRAPLRRTHMLEITEKKAMQLLSKLENSWDRLVDMLYVKYGKLLLYEHPQP